MLVTEMRHEQVNDKTYTVMVETYWDKSYRELNTLSKDILGMEGMLGFIDDRSNENPEHEVVSRHDGGRYNRYVVVMYNKYVYALKDDLSKEHPKIGELYGTVVADERIDKLYQYLKGKWGYLTVTAALLNGDDTKSGIVRTIRDVESYDELYVKSVKDDAVQLVVGAITNSLETTYVEYYQEEEVE